MSSRSAKVPSAALIAIGIVLLLHSVYLWQMGQWLWSREHYQFFPLILVGSVGLCAFRLQDAAWLSQPNFSLRVAAYCCVSVAIMLLATVADSHWLGTLSALTLGWAALWYAGGREITKRVRAPYFFLLLAVPFPLNLDISLIVSMQKLATSAAGQLLDNFGITHTISGVAIRTDLREFMVEEACSGIHSLFSCVTAMVFWGIINRYGLVRILLTIVQTTAWVLMANSIRVFLIVFARHRFGADLESGTAHELLGVCTYALSLFLSLSMDQLLRFLIPVGLKPFQAESISGGYGRYSNADENSAPMGQKIENSKSRINRKLNRPMIGATARPSIPIIVTLCIFIPLSSLAIAHQFRARGTSQQNYFVQSIADAIPEALLPTQIGNWKQISSRTVNRSPDDPLGTNSVVWMFEGNGITANVSVDGYYSDFHDLSGCYSGLGWELESSQNRQVGDEVPITELSLYKGSGQFGISMFTCLDNTNAHIEPPAPAGTAFRLLLNRLRSGDLISRGNVLVNPPVYQIQVMATRESQLLEHEKRLLEELFLSLHGVIRNHMSAQGVSQ